MESLLPGISGFIAGLVSTSLLQPIDVIKVRLQVQEGQHYSTDASSPAHPNETTRSRRRIGTMQMLRGIVKYEGVRGLYVGLAPAVVGSSLSWGGYFYVYETFKRQRLHWKLTQTSKMKEHQAQNKVVALNAFDHFFLSCAAGAVMVAITNPIWLVKTRMQLQMKKASEQHNVQPYKGMGDAFVTIVRNEGLHTLYRGSGAAFLLTSNGGIQFAVYEYLRKLFNVQRDKHSAKIRKVAGQENRTVSERFQKSFGFMTIGAVSKIIASTITYPLQLAKSRIQQRAEAFEFTEDGKIRLVKRHYGGLFESLWRVARTEGIAGLFKGCLMNALRVAPNAAVTFVVYETMMDFLTIQCLGRR